MLSNKISVASHNQSGNNKSSYRGIFKATSLFGGLQVYQIIIGIIRSKFIAVLLGPEGMGISGLLQSGIDLIMGCTSFGISQSAVRDVAEANGTNNQDRINRTVSVLRRIVWLTGLLGMLVTILFAPLLSKTSFGDFSYMWSFIILSVILLLNQLRVGQSVVLQGFRKYNYLVKSSAIGITLGLILTIPLYYWFGNDGIVPALVINAIISFSLTWYFSNKIPIDRVPLSRKEVFCEGKTMMSLGLIMSLNGLLVLGCAYAIRTFISKHGGLDQVGLYNAGFAIVNTYVGMIFSAMATDYYPRLAAVNKDNIECTKIVNQQAEISVLIIAPIAMVCMVFTPLLLLILYSERFVAANGLICWAVAGMIFKAISWSISYMYVAKADKKIFIINECIINIFHLIINILFYILWGLTGLGIAFALNYFVYLILVYFVGKKKYGFNISKQLFGIVSVQLILTGLVIISVYTLEGWIYYLLASLFIVVSSFYSFYELNKRMDIVSHFKREK